MSKTVLVVGSIASAILVASMAAVLTAVPGVGKPRTVTLVGAGDTPSGARSSARGIRQFIVGTGGAPGVTQHGPDEPRVQAKKIGEPGVLKLKLGSGFYRWRFVPVGGRNYTESGRARCH